MSRTNATAVQAIIEVDSTINLLPFIEAASSIVDDVCTNSGYSDEKLERIERWLAAHFYTIRDNRISSEAAGPVSASYKITTGLMLSSSMYGQTAQTLDTAGNLAALSKRMEDGVKAKVGIVWLGSEDC